MISIKVEEVSPALAHEYLAKSIGNRTLNTDYVLSLAVAMERGEWNEGASEVVFDEDGVLIDGHHRLTAVTTFGASVRMAVKRGVSKSARGVIDTGRTRTIRDLHAMFRPAGDFLSQRKAALTTCVSLLVVSRAPPAIRTLDAYDSWMRHFKDGIDAMIDIGREGGARSRGFRLGTVTGALAFAHKTNPQRIEAFALKVRDGENIASGDPAYTIRAMLASSDRIGHTGGDRTAMSRKVLSAAFHDLKGRKYSKAQAGSEGLDHFRGAYDTRAVEKLVQLWTPAGVPSQ